MTPFRRSKTARREIILGKENHPLLKSSFSDRPTPSGFFLRRAAAAKYIKKFANRTFGFDLGWLVFVLTAPRQERLIAATRKACF